MNLIKKGSADITRYIMLVDSTAGTPETGYTITDLDLQYTRNRTAPVAKVDAVALAATDTAHTDNRAIQIDATSSPGLYRVDWPDAAFATGVDKVTLVVSGTGLHPATEEIQLVNFDPEDVVRLGLTALPNFAADAAGGLPISDAGGLDLDAKLANTNEVTAARMGALTDWINGGRLDLIIDSILDDTGTAGVVVNAAGLATDAVEEIRNAITGGAYDLDTDANGRIRIVDGTAAGEINTNAGAIALVDLVTLVATTTTLTNDPTGVGTLLTRLGTPSNLGGGATVAANLSDIEAQTDDIGAAGAGLTSVVWNADWDAQVQSEVQDAIEVNHLDHLLAVDYDPASKPGIATALLNELIGSDAGVSQFTANALELAPTGGSAPTVGQIADAVWDEAQADHVAAGSFGETATEIASILVDTNELQTDWANGGRLDLLIDAILDDTGTAGVVVNAAGLATDAVQEIRNAITGGAWALDTDSNGRVRVVDGTATGEINTASGAIVQVDQLGTQAKADVNAELVDVMAVDTHAQPGQDTPAATTTYSLMLRRIYKQMRNLKEQTATEFKLYNDDAVTVDQKAAVSDSGTVFSFAELITGP